jgi:hypothetical protein
MKIEGVFALFGPVSSASPNGGGPFWNMIGLLIPGWVLLTVWRKYLSREPGAHVPKGNLAWITAICVIMIGFSVWGFAH